MHFKFLKSGLLFLLIGVGTAIIKKLQSFNFSIFFEKKKFLFVFYFFLENSNVLS